VTRSLKGRRGAIIIQLEVDRDSGSESDANSESAWQSPTLATRESPCRSPIRPRVRRGRRSRRRTGGDSESDAAEPASAVLSRCPTRRAAGRRQSDSELEAQSVSQFRVG
jgi:hypothetical protein